MGVGSGREGIQAKKLQMRRRRIGLQCPGTEWKFWDYYCSIWDVGSEKR
jgi:hypothetical protein